jgi:hypothetical protein
MKKRRMRKMISRTRARKTMLPSLAILTMARMLVPHPRSQLALKRTAK